MNHPAMASAALDRAVSLVDAHTVDVAFPSEPIRDALVDAKQHVSSMPDKAEAKEFMLMIVGALRDLPAGTVGPAETAIGQACGSFGFTPYSFLSNGAPVEWIVPGSPGSESYIAFLEFKKHAPAIQAAAARLAALGELEAPEIPQPVSLRPGEATALLLQKMGEGFTEGYCRKLVSGELKKPHARTPDGKRVWRTAVIKLAQEKVSKAAEREDQVLEREHGKKTQSVTPF